MAKTKEKVKPKDREYGKLMGEDWEPPKNLNDAKKRIQGSRIYISKQLGSFILRLGHLLPVG